MSAGVDRGLLVDDFKVLYRVHPVLNVSDVSILKASTHVEDAVHCLYVRQEGVP